MNLLCVSCASRSNVIQQIHSLMDTHVGNHCVLQCSVNQQYIDALELIEEYLPLLFAVDLDGEDTR